MESRSFRRFAATGALLAMLLVAACTTGLQFPAYDIRIAPSADTKADLRTIDGILRSQDLVPIADANVGRTAIMPCIGRMKVLGSYRLTDATGVYVGQLDDGRISVTLTDTAKLGAAFTEQDRAAFTRMAEGFSRDFGTARVFVPQSWGGALLHCENGPDRPVWELGH